MTAAEQAPAAGRTGAMSHLFGRRLVFAFVVALQLLGATLVSPVLAHLLGPASFGQLATAIAVYQVLVVLASLGLDQAVVLQRAEDPDDLRARGLLMTSLVVAAIVALIAGLTGPLWAPALGFAGFSGLLVATVLWTAPGAGVQGVLGLLSTEDRLRAFTTISLLSTLGGPVLGLVLLGLLEVDNTVYALGGVFSQMAALLVGIWCTRPRLAGLVDWATARKAMAVGLPLAVSALSVFVLNAGDRVIVQRELGSAEVGRYQVAYTVGSAVILLVAYVGQAWTPSLASTSDPVERARLVARSRDELLGLLQPLVLGGTLAAPLLLPVVAPASFRPTELLDVTLLVILAAFPVAVSGGTARLLLTSRRTRPLARVTVVCAVVNIGLNLVLVPTAGLAGSALATLLAFSLQAVLQQLALRDRSALPAPPRPLVLAVVTVCVASAASTLLPQSFDWNAARVVGGAFCLVWVLRRLARVRRLGS